MWASSPTRLPLVDVGRRLGAAVFPTKKRGAKCTSFFYHSVAQRATPSHRPQDDISLNALAGISQPPSAAISPSATALDITALRHCPYGGRIRVRASGHVAHSAKESLRQNLRFCHLPEGELPQSGKRDRPGPLTREVFSRSPLSRDDVGIVPYKVAIG